MKPKAAISSAIDFVQKATLSKQAMRCLVQPDQHAVHKMAGDEHQRYRQPVKVAIDGEAQRSLRGIENCHHHWEGRLAHPMRLMWFNHGILSWR